LHPSALIHPDFHALPQHQVWQSVL
jgi:hypothetical protein